MARTSPAPAGTKMNEKDLLACCGLYCGDCFIYQGKIADLSRDLRKELRQSRFDKAAASLAEVPFFAVLKNYPQCYEVLGALVRFRCRRACRGGGGPPNCRIRKCCQKKGIDGCWQCDEFVTCSKLDDLNAMHGDAHRKNLNIIKKQGLDGLIQGKRYW